MSNVFVKIILAITVLSFLAEPALAQSRVATIDLRKVFDNFWKRKHADAAVKEEAALMEKDHTGMIAELRKSEDEYQKLLADANDQAVSAEEREKRKKAAADKLRQIDSTKQSIVAYERSARARLEERLKRMREDILGEIRTVITSKAQAANYTLVIDTAAETANNTPVILYSSGKEHDLTESVLAQLNAAAPADVSRPAATNPPPSKKR